MNTYNSRIDIYTNSNIMNVQQNRSEIVSGIFIYIEILRSTFSRISNFLFFLKLNKYLKYLFIFYFFFLPSLFFRNTGSDL
jgi:hypothetical protein